MAWLLFLFLALIPIIEIMVILEVYAMMGFAFTVWSIILTSLLGVYSLQREGLAVWRTVRERVTALQVPISEMLESVLIVVGGLMLLTPGFVTDLLGAVLVLPYTRRAMARGFLARTFNATLLWSIDAYNDFQSDRQAGRRQGDSAVYDADAVEVDIEVDVDAGGVHVSVSELLVSNVHQAAAESGAGDRPTTAALPMSAVDVAANGLADVAPQPPAVDEPGSKGPLEKEEDTPK